MKAILRTLAVSFALLFAVNAAYAQPQSGAVQLLPAEDLESEEFPEFDPTIAQENGYQVDLDEATGEYKIRSSFSAVWAEILRLLERFLFNLLISWIIVHFFYFRKNGRTDYYFTFLIFSSAMFLLLFVMNNLSLQIGFTLGLFAIFGMIRYRTEAVPVREMTYLFIIIALSVINGVGAEMPILEIVVANVVVLLLILALEQSKIIRGRTSTKLVIYDRIDLVVPEKRTELIEDLEKRAGLKVKSLEIGQIDFIRDCAWIKVTYFLAPGEENAIDSLRRSKDFLEDR